MERGSLARIMGRGLPVRTQEIIMKIQIGHSPDADDAFMFYALTYHKFDTGDYEFEHILKDIETLNRWAL